MLLRILITIQRFVELSKHHFASERVLSSRLIRCPLDEAGFDVLVGSEDSLVPSRMYSEKSFVMAKGFIKTALSNTPRGLIDVVHWLYRAHSGPRLLDRVVRECQDKSQRPLTTSQTTHADDGIRLCEDNISIVEESWIGSVEKLSTGALVTLHRYIESLVEYEKECEQKKDAATANTPNDGPDCGS